MSRFVDLKVTDLQKTTEDAVVVSLLPADGSILPFHQGQYLTFRKEIEGTELRRAYSICSGVNDGVLQVGIKRVNGGAFSNWANDDLAVGDVMQALTPMGNFHTPLNPNAHHHYIGFAIGSGITPILSIMKSTLEVEPHARFTLVYVNRSVNQVMFREELEDLKNEYMSRLSIIHIFKTGQDVDLFSGRLDAEKLEALYANWIDVDSVDTAFICGPEDVMKLITESLSAHGLSDDQIKYELFVGSQTGRLDRAAVADDASGEDAVEANIIIDGTAYPVASNRNTSILDAALAIGLDAPYACKAGVCSTCRCKVIEGEVEMLTNHALDDYELKAGYVLSCQSLPRSEKVTVEYDH